MDHVVRLCACVLFVLVGGLLPAAAPDSPPSELAGTASVVDGDTIEIHGQRIRLHGFDAPERGSLCGTVNVFQRAAFALSDFIGARTVSCKIAGRDVPGRRVAA